MKEKFLRNPMASLCGIYALIVLAVFPLIFHDYYFDIVDVKYIFYWVTSLIFIVLSLVTFCVLRVRGKKAALDDSGKQVSEKRCGLAFLKDLKSSWPVWMLIIFWVNTLISTLQSDFLYESVWGNEGRYTGLFLISIYTVTTLLLVFFSEPKRWYLDAFLVTSCIVEILGILDYGGLDVLQFGRFGEQVGEMAIFTSTIGNVNFYTAFLSMSLACVAVLYIIEKDKKRRCIYFLLSIVAYCAMILGQSDNAYITIGFLFLFLPFAFFDSRTGIFRVFVQFTIFAVSMCVLVVLNDVFRDVGGDQGIFVVIGSTLLFRIATLGLLLLTGGLYYLCRNEEGSGKSGEDRFVKNCRRGWKILVTCGAVALGIILLDANALGNSERYAKIARYVVFNDNWGTERGFAWRVGLTAWREQPLMHRLFGYGPETFGILTWEYRKASTNAYGFIFDSMHNEYLQNLVTMGPVGMLSYIGLNVGTVIKVWKCAKNQPWMYAIAFAVLCYSAQSMVNISMPIVAPVCWALMGLGLSACRLHRNRE